MSSLLHPFQEDTVRHAYRCLTEEKYGRFLIADEVGLGKTLAAREIIRKFLEDAGKNGREDFTVVYICNNQLLAKKNLGKLNPGEMDDEWEVRMPAVNRLSLFPLGLFCPDRGKKDQKKKRVCSLYALTPGTSFSLTHGWGTAPERHFLYRLGGGDRAEGSPEYRKGVRAWECFDACNAERYRLIREDIDSRIKEDPGDQLSELTRLCDKPDFPRLRTILSLYGASLLKPDLVIFDEFQNYDYLFWQQKSDDDGFGREIDIINTEFAKLDPPPKYLLLSATPFARLTMQEELARGEVNLSSCDAFCRLIAFLENDVKSSFAREWKTYADRFRKYCLDLTEGRSADQQTVREARDQVQNRICNVMSRTERDAGKRDHLVASMDLKHSVLGGPEGFSAAGLFSGAEALAEYEKYAFCPLSGMGQDYRTFQKLFDPKLFLNDIKDTMNSPYMQKLNALLCENSSGEKKLRPLFWIPPTVPTLELQGAFAEASKEGYSKVLIFSRYRFIPRMISTGLSAKLERDHPAEFPEYKFFEYTEGKPQLSSGIRELLTLEGFDFEKDDREEDLQSVFRSPAKSVCWAFRKLLSGTEISEETKKECRLWSVLIAYALLHSMLNNMNYVYAAAGIENKEKTRCQLAAEYCLMGCFADAAYEYMYLLEQEQHHADPCTRVRRIGKLFYSVLRLHTNTLEMYIQPEAGTSGAEPSSGKKEIKEYARKFRTHFAVCFSEKEKNTASFSGNPEENNPDREMKNIVLMLDAVLGQGAAAHLDKEDLKEQPDRNRELQSAFNSPFKPFVLSSTSIGQEGLDFHWYCRKIMHWNLPSNPVEFDQREGRINRYGSFALRQSLAAGLSQDREKEFSWKAFWEGQEKDASGMTPYWLPPEGHSCLRPIERIVPFYPLSREHLFLNDLLKMQALYRMIIGQPHQDELLSLLRDLADSGGQEKLRDITACTICLRPPQK